MDRTVALPYWALALYAISLVLLAGTVLLLWLQLNYVCGYVSVFPVPMPEPCGGVLHA